MNNKYIDPNKEFLKKLEDALNIYSRALLAQSIKKGIKKSKEKKYA